MNLKGNRKFLILAAVLVLVLALAVGGTIAYFTYDEVVHNVITTSGLELELHEYDENGDPFKDIEGAVPGGSYGKKVVIENTGEAASWIRMKVTKDIKLAGEGTPNLDLIKLDMNKKDWTYGDDGYWYYNYALEAGDTTEPLFTTVTIDAGMGNLYQKATLKIDVQAYGVQAANNGTSALTAEGWPA